MSMGVYIKGMEMPRNCIECRFENFNNCDVLDKRVESVDVPHWCPLIEVPPHGRLIDGDALAKDIDKAYDELNNGKDLPFRERTVAYVFAQKIISHAPTIIEAEEGEG